MIDGAKCQELLDRLMLMGYSSFTAKSQIPSIYQTPETQTAEFSLDLRGWQGKDSMCTAPGVEVSTGSMGTAPGVEASDGIWWVPSSLE